MITIKRLAVVWITLCCLLMCSLTVYADSPVTPKNSFGYRGTDVISSIESPYRTYQTYLKDEAEILPEKAEKDLWEKLQAVSENTNVKLAVFIGGNYRTDIETENFTYDCVAALFGTTADALFIYLDFEGQSPAYDYIRAFNGAERTYTEAKRTAILNTMYRYLPKSTEPVYASSVQQALDSGLNEIEQAGYTPSTSTAPSVVSTVPPANNTPPAQTSNSTIKGEDLLNIFRSIPSWVIYVGIGLIILLVIVSAIKRAARRHRSSQTYTNSYPSSDYYNTGFHHGYHSSSYRHRSPPHHPPRSSRPPRRSSPPSHSSSSSSSSHSDSSRSSSGTGMHR